MNATIPTCGSRYQLHCHGCDKCWPDPKDFYVAKAIAWAHQHRASGPRPHIVEFIPVEAVTERGNDARAN